MGTEMKRSAQDMDRDLSVLLEELRSPRTMEHLIDYLQVDRRTVYRWLNTLETKGRSIIRVGLSGPTRYQILH